MRGQPTPSATSARCMLWLTAGGGKLKAPRAEARRSSGPYARALGATLVNHAVLRVDTAAREETSSLRADGKPAPLSPRANNCVFPSRDARPPGQLPVLVFVECGGACARRLWWLHPRLDAVGCRVRRGGRWRASSRRGWGRVRPAAGTRRPPWRPLSSPPPQASAAPTRPPPPGTAVAACHRAHGTPAPTPLAPFPPAPIRPSSPLHFPATPGTGLGRPPAVGLSGGGGAAASRPRQSPTRHPARHQSRQPTRPVADAAPRPPSMRPGRRSAAASGGRRGVRRCSNGGRVGRRPLLAPRDMSPLAPTPRLNGPANAETMRGGRVCMEASALEGDRIHGRRGWGSCGRVEGVGGRLHIPRAARQLEELRRLAAASASVVAAHGDPWAPSHASMSHGLHRLGTGWRFSLSAACWIFAVCFFLSFVAVPIPPPPKYPLEDHAPPSPRERSARRFCPV